MLNVMILDDERPCRMHIASLISENFENIRIAGEADSVEGGLEIISHQPVDILFLDVDLGKSSGTGFDLLSNLSSPSFDLVVLSDNDQHALEAFNYGASDYLLKPVCEDRLKRALEKLTRKLHSRPNSTVDNYTEAGVLNRKIGLYDKYELNFTKLSDIYYCQAEGFYTRFFLKSGKQILVSKNIKEYEYLLPQKFFFRSHKSYLINLNEINKYVKVNGGYVVMENGDEIPVAVRKKEDFLRSIMNFQFNGNLRGACYE